MFTNKLLDSIKHGFFTRNGGVSSAPFDSLSFVVTKGDDLENVRQNRQIALQQLNLADHELVTANQVHGTTVVYVNEPWGFDNGKTPDADAIITQNPDLVLGVFTADCVPILMLDEKTNTIAAVHSGWKGTRSGIVQECISKMVDLGADREDIKAVIGPCIAQDNYEIGPEVFTEFFSASPQYIKFFKNSVNPGKYMFDISGLVQFQLLQAGLVQVENMCLDTYSQPEHFFSCRRSFHKGEQTFGCFLSAISLKQSA